MRNKLLFYAARVILWSIGLFLIWEWFLGNIYLALVAQFAQMAFEILGRYKESCQFLAEAFYSLIPYLALGIAHKLKISKKLKKLLYGSLILFGWHILLSVLICEVYGSTDFRFVVFSELAFLIFNGAVPMALWIWFFRQEIRQLLP